MKFIQREKRIVIFMLFYNVLTSPITLSAAPNLQGQNGFINMPDARIAEEGTLNVGYSYLEPYRILWSNISLFPRLAMSARYTSIDNTTSFSNDPNADFGLDKDKAFDAKLVVLKEGSIYPQIAIGTQDYLGTRLFSARFISISKAMGDVDISLGYGKQRINGLFAGLSYKPVYLKNWSFHIEHDANDYQNDHKSLQSGAYERQDKTAFAVHYQWGWLGSKLVVQNGKWGINAFLSVPLMWPEFIAKINEPPPYSTTIEKVTIGDWQSNPSHADALISALHKQSFRNVKIYIENQDVIANIASERISLIGRAVGRAARTILLMGPVGQKKIIINYLTLSDMGLLTYSFTDLDKLDQYFSGKLSDDEILKTIRVEYANPELIGRLNHTRVFSSDFASEDQGFKLNRNDEGHAVTLSHKDYKQNNFRIIPFSYRLFFNDPSGAFKYYSYLSAQLVRNLGNSTFFNSSIRIDLWENVSDVKQESNSVLPHVRTDVAKYKQERGAHIDNLLLNKFSHFQPRVYSRFSIGLYEEMYGGMGAQILYIPKQGNWAADLAVDWLKQREYDGGLQFRNYSTTTALAAFHYNFKDQGINLTLRAGRFLAKDSGARLEFARTFQSGFKIGAWYTYTDGDDITNPGSPSEPYRDKGIFIHIPFKTMLASDTRASATMSISPWTRDVGQMVRSPADLYTVIEDELLLHRSDLHLLSSFYD